MRKPSPNDTLAARGTARPTRRLPCASGGKGGGGEGFRRNDAWRRRPVWKRSGWKGLRGRGEERRSEDSIGRGGWGPEEEDGGG
jgi:hypothetical protein